MAFIQVALVDMRFPHLGSSIGDEVGELRGRGVARLCQAPVSGAETKGSPVPGCKPFGVVLS